MSDIVFYSWQSDLPSKTNRGFIRTALESAISSGTLAESDRDFSIDSDTLGVPGAPDVKSVILDKIERATVFIADVSLINSGFDRRPLTPNPNVLFELGYAVRALGWERILLVFNQSSGSIEQLPFDIRAHRPVVYALADTDGDRASVRKDLVIRFGKAIEAIAQSLPSRYPEDLVTLKPYWLGSIDNPYLRFKLFNLGAVSISPTSVEVDVPSIIIRNATNWYGDSNIISHEETVVDGVSIVRARFRRFDGPVDTLAHGTPKRMPAEFSPGEAAQLWHLRCGLVPDFLHKGAGHAIAFRIYASGRTPIMGRVEVSKIQKSNSEEGSDIMP